MSICLDVWRRRVFHMLSLLMESYILIFVRKNPKKSSTVLWTFDTKSNQTKPNHWRIAKPWLIKKEKPLNRNQKQWPHSSKHRLEMRKLGRRYSRRSAPSATPSIKALVTSKVGLSLSDLIYLLFDYDYLVNYFYV